MTAIRKTMTVSWAGHEYTVEIEGNRIVRIACKGRWPMTDRKMIDGDDYLAKSLEYKLGLTYPEE